MKLVLVFVLGLLGSTPSLAYAETASFRDIEESLTCQCGCGLTVHSCNHLQCPSAIPLREEIRAQLAEGKSRDEILAYFENKYGEKILSAPVARGFNLAAWVVPFLAVGLGGVVVAVVVRRWKRADGSPGGEASPSPEPRHLDILKRELEEFGE
ncbi:MAG: hypothetical protein KatS3mg076_2156 [Candidatus Binatia bacterium]|nr:MAG: hypothetical protein KatS3mg076_2156 [Candidatus Binatia bacterium]